MLKRAGGGMVRSNRRDKAVTRGGEVKTVRMKLFSEMHPGFTSSRYFATELPADAVVERADEVAILVKKFRDAFRYLEPRYKEVVRRRYGFTVEPQTLDEVAAAIGVTRERVRQLELRAVFKVRTRLVDDPHFAELVAEQRAEEKARQEEDERRRDESDKWRNWWPVSTSPASAERPVRLPAG